jgi:hypothetical protein
MFINIEREYEIISDALIDEYGLTIIREELRCAVIRD